MAHPSDALREHLIQAVVEPAERRLDGPRAAAAAGLARHYLAGLTTGDLEQTDGQALYGTVMSLLAFLRERPPGRPKLRVFDPDLEQHGWASPHTVVEMVNDDMPFLVDSVSADLARQGIAVHLLVHPIPGAIRDAGGKLARLLSPGERDPAARPESVMHIEIDRQGAGAHRAIEASLAQVLAEVRLAVDDWRAMRARIAETADGLAGTASDPAAVAEADAFLRWLHDDHFTFLGARRFHFKARGKADDAPMVEVDETANLGVLRPDDARVFDDAVALAAMPPVVRGFLTRPEMLLVTKSARHSRIHRPVHMDVIGVKRLDAKGRVVGMDAFLGLFTSAAYTRVPASIPLLRSKVAGVMERAALQPGSHDAKALAVILDTFPRDELFQIAEDSLYHTAMGILKLQDRPRVALFVRRDEFERFVSCLVFVPRDRYDTPLRMAVQTMLAGAFGGAIDAYYTQISDAPLARLHIVVRVAPGAVAEVDLRELEARLAEAARAWPDHLQSALVQAHGEAAGLLLARRYGQAFPASYRESHPVGAALTDIDRLEAVLEGADIALGLYRPVEAAEHEARLKLYHRGSTVPLSDVLPMLEAMGLKVIAEVPHEIRPAEGGTAVWIHDFAVESVDRRPIDLGGRRAAFEEALIRVWRAEAECDGFNRLVLAAGLDWREVAVLRAYAKYLRQAGATYSQAYLERALADNAEVATALVRLYLAEFDPDQRCGDPTAARAALQAALERVASADDDRILRRFLNLIQATLRTNYFQQDAAGSPKPYLAFKLDSRAVDDLPLPRPLVEIWVCSPRVEAVHLRGGKVARGGIRWSDRREDFRTEVLGLMKAQMVKNAVIVPVGAKGGFVVKRPPADGGRQAFQAEGVACYQTFMRGLLDLTDNIEGDATRPPPRVVRKDGDDPYLVVAADKGTATFSDIANAISIDYGHWLGDAFASGGSQGYDHKAMGITARGAWVAVERHFRELGLDTRTQDFTVIGVGDMSGDVFGNAMLRSPHAKLMAAFNHSHIFLDPDPDPARGFAERQRLFTAVKAWPDYDPSTISAGGGVFPRTAKSIPLSPQVRARFGIDAPQLSPTELIKLLLAAEVDLLLFGGIGTYVKATRELNAEVGDRANDQLRINGRDIRARVIGEGANLGFTQRGRVEYALAGAGGGGGRINTDAIDNSAGVDTSDHEVNIKILVDDLVAAGDLTAKQRDKLLSSMTDEVGRLVLRDNYLQTQAITIMEAQGADLLDGIGRFMRLLEKQGRLNRELEFLPDDETMTERAARRQGLMRPELAVMLAYAKIWVYDHVLASKLPDDPFLAQDLVRYFPAALGERFADRIPGHRLSREIIATTITNSMVNRVGGAFITELMENTGQAPAAIARAYIVARDAFRLRQIWAEIEALDGIVAASAQTAMMIEANRLVERATVWVLRSVKSPFDIGATIAELSPGVALLETILPPEAAAAVEARGQHFMAQGVPEPLARRVGNLIVLASAADIVRVAASQGLPIERAGRLYFAVGTRFSLGWLRASAERLSGRGHWDKLAAAAIIEELYAHQRDLTIAVAVAGSGLDGGGDPEAALAVWAEKRPATLERTDALLAELKAAGRIELSMLTVAARQLATLSR